MSEHCYQLSDNNTRITIAAGDTVIIKLPENATTGFEWNFVSSTAGVVTFEGASKSPASPFSALGAGGGQAVMRFKALAQGRGNIELILSRGMTANPSDTRYVLNIDVK